MDGQLRTGQVLVCESARKCSIVSLLGAGGQGEVYDAEVDGQHYALKWYFPHMATPEQKAILERLVAKGAPDTTFLWPLDLVYDAWSTSFGYIMPLRPGRYRSIVDLMKRRAEPPFFALTRSAYLLTRGYLKLHACGYSYRDISFGNVFFDPDTGDVLICDNDNVSASGLADSAVYGTARFMAPEIVVGQAGPSRNTDLYSLSVLLFYMFMIGHPLEGQREADIRCMDLPAMQKLYGTDPVFVYDPQNDSNRPVPGYQDNVILFWQLYPRQIRDLFTHAFTEGLHSPNRRVTERQWLDAFASLLTGIAYCPVCGAEVFYDEEKGTHLCWNCHNTVPIPPILRIGKKRVLLHPQGKLYSHCLWDDYDMDTVCGEVVQNPKRADLWGIKNTGGDTWTYIRADGQRIPVAPGRSAAIAQGVQIEFGTCRGEIVQTPCE